MSQSQTIQPSQPTPPIPWEIPTIGGLFFVALIVIGAEKLGFLGSKKQVLGRARFATWGEKRKAAKYAYQQLHSPKLSDVALWINEPKGLEVIDKRIIIPFNRMSTWIGNGSQSISVIGATNAGKSYSVLDPLKRSALIQGHSMIDFDAKGNEKTPPSCSTGGTALAYGYQVWVIDSSGDDSDSINLWDGLRNDSDSDGALILADSFLANMGKIGGSNGDFFKQSAGMLLAAIILMVKSCDRQYQDFATVLKIVALPNLIGRVLENMDSLGEYQKGLWAQFLSQSQNPETAQSIAGTATLVLGRMFTPELLAVFRGDGTVPLELHGRQKIIFRYNPNKTNQKPIIGAAMEMAFRRSVFTQSGRDNPIAFFKDEAPQIITNGLSEILSVSRSLGGYAVLGMQGKSIMEKSHGKEETNALLGATKTIIFGGMRGNEDCEYFSRMLGQKEIQVHNRSRSHGKNSSRSNSENAQTTELMAPHEVRGLKQGQFVFISPNVGSDLKAIPFKLDVRISKREQKSISDGLKSWQELREKRTPKPLTEEELREREALAYELLPSEEDEPPELFDED